MGCGIGGKKLCPISLGLALGITSAFAVFFGTVWMMYFGVSPEMAARMMVPLTLMGGFIHALWALLEGFLFGFFLALFYDLFACIKACCRKKGDGTCECPCCGKTMEKGPTVKM